ncbi:MAG: YbdK family carboxylate-amine ligase [Solirubrobacteraceae bacterium]
MSRSSEPVPSAEELSEAFDAAAPHTVGFEDEVMLLDPETCQLAPVAERVVDLMGGDERFKLELPANQLEIVTDPVPSVPEASRGLLAARSELARRTRGEALLAAAGVHPFSPGSGELNGLPRYRHTIDEYGPLARRQLVCAFQVHVAPGDADRALAAYNASRSYLPLIAALAANAPFYEGRDSGLASVRPKLCELLPRQGVPPALNSWEEFTHILSWGEAAGSFHPGAWWWELRPHRRFGTLEFRVPDGQSSVADAAAVAAVVQSLVAWLGERHDTGEPLGVAPAWRIAENRWSACRHGVEGRMADLDTGRLRPTQVCLHELLDELEPVAERLRCSTELGLARGLVERNGSMRQRQVAAEEGMVGLGRWLSERFLDPSPG